MARYARRVKLQRDRFLRRGDYIYGSFVKPEIVDGYINAVNPGDRSDTLGRFPFSTRNVDDAVDAASRGGRSWRRVGLMERAAAVRRFRDHLAAQQEPLARVVSRETGKPLWEARQEVATSVRAIDLYLDDGLALIAPRLIEEIGGRTDYVPRGVVAMVCPYNVPALLGSTLSAAAILGGNALVMKPSKFTPGTGQFIAELWDRCKLPRGVFNLVLGSASVIGQRLISNPGIDALIFHGSAEAAREIRRTLADRPEVATLFQCGGKGQALVLDDAEIDRAVYEVLVGAFLSSGQRHNSTARVIVTERVFETFTSQLLRRVRNVRVGYFTDPDVFMGPLISEIFRARFRKYNTNLIARGHTALLEGDGIEVPGFRGNYVRPGIFRVNWENGHPFLGEEPPGPVLLIYRVKGIEEAVQLHNQSVFRGATAVFTRPDNPHLPELRDALRTGVLNVNRGTIGSSLRLPAVGMGRSSNGIPAGVEAMRFLTAPRASLTEPRPFDPAALVPGIGWEQQQPHGDDTDPG